MAVTPSFRTFVLDQLGRVVAGVRGLSMFGGVGIYAGETFFALIADDVLYLKVDDTNRPDYEARGLAPFQPFGESGETMQYYAAPAELLEDPEALQPWVDKSIAAARRAKTRPRRRPGR